MDKSKKVGAQIYGYGVCLVAIITFLISISTLVNAIIDLSNPIYAGWRQAGDPSLASFENYKLDIIRSLPKSETSEPSYVPDDATLRTMYDAARNDKIQSSIHKGKQSIILGSILIITCITLFVSHWRWMQNIRKE